MKKAEIQHIIFDVFDGLEKNNFKTLGRAQSPMWERPLVGIAAGNDAYYDFLKEHIGAFHMKPEEIL